MYTSAFTFYTSFYNLFVLRRTGMRWGDGESQTLRPRTSLHHICSGLSQLVSGRVDRLD